MEKIIEGLLFLKPEGLKLDQIKELGFQPEELLNKLNELYKDTVLMFEIRGGYLVMDIKPDYIPEISKYYEKKDLTDKQIKILGLLKINKKISKSEILKKIDKNELLDLYNRNFIIFEKIEKKEYVKLGPKYFEYFKDV